MCNPTRAIFTKILLNFDFFFKSHQNVLLCLPHRATSVLHLLEPRIATITPTIAAAAIVLRTSSHSCVSRLTQPLGLDSGSQHFALQQAVAARVSAMDFVEIIVKNSFQRCGHLTKLSWQLS